MTDDADSAVNYQQLWYKNKQTNTKTFSQSCDSHFERKDKRMLSTLVMQEL